jgi:hypothetical protein
MRLFSLSLFVVALSAPAPAIASVRPFCFEPDEHFIALLEEEVGKKCQSYREVVRGDGIAEAMCNTGGITISRRFECRE